MRDAISLLDQAISFSDGQLSAEKITRMLGRINKTDLKQFLVHLSKKQSQQALELLNKQLESGLGIERFSDELIEYCRELLLIKECGIDSGILEYSRSYLEEIASAAANLSTKEITQIIDEFASLKEKLRSSARPRLQLEISVIKLSSRESSGSGLEARLSEIEFKLNNLLTNKDNSNFKKELTAKKSELGSAAVDDNIQKNKEESTNDSSDQQKAQIEEDSQSKKEIEPKTPAVKENAKSDSSAGTGNLSLEQVKDNWGRVLNEIRQLDVSVQALLREGEPLAVDKKTVTVAFPETKKFHYKGAVSNKALISRVLRNVLNEAVELELQLGAKKKELNEARTNQAKKNDADIVEDSSNSQNNKKTKTPASKSKENDNFAGDLDIENLARIFSGEIIEVDQSILENRGGK
jgi:DNA polymerase-3 subunit gamma/tau